MKRNENGSAAIEMVVLTPVLLCVLLLVVAGGRLVTAHNDVNYAAKVGARAASTAHNRALAETTGRDAVESTLAEQNVSCSQLAVTIDASELWPGGQATATLDCNVDLSMTSLLGLPLTKSIRATFTEPVDVFVGTAS